MLPQGEFARFLKGEPGERRKTLVALLGLGAYERMGILARDRSKELRIKGEQTRTILAEQYADATPETLAEADRAANAAVSAAETAGDTLSTARDIDRRRTDAVAHGATAAGLGERLAALARRDPRRGRGRQDGGIRPPRRQRALPGSARAARGGQERRCHYRRPGVVRGRPPWHPGGSAHVWPTRLGAGPSSTSGSGETETSSTAAHTLTRDRSEHEACVAVDVQAEAALEEAGLPMRRRSGRGPARRRAGRPPAAGRCCGRRRAPTRRWRSGSSASARSRRSAERHREAHARERPGRGRLDELKRAPGRALAAHLSPGIPAPCASVRSSSIRRSNRTSSSSWPSAERRSTPPRRRRIPHEESRRPRRSGPSATADRDRARREAVAKALGDSQDQGAWNRS